MGVYGNDADMKLSVTLFGVTSFVNGPFQAGFFVETVVNKLETYLSQFSHDLGAWDQLFRLQVLS